MTRKFLVRAGLTALALSLAVPAASAHTDDRRVEWVSPTPRANDDVAGSREIAARAVDFNIEKFKVEVLTPGPDRTYPAWGALATCSRNGREITCDWDTTRYLDGRLSVNGEYLLRAEIWNDPGLLGSSHPHTASRLVWVENAPADLAGLNRSFDSNTGKLTVSWAANPEPDISRYVVQRYKGTNPDPATEQSVPAGSRCPNDANRVCYTQALAEPGSYRYRVSPVRYSGEEQDGQRLELEGHKWEATQAFELAAAPEAPRSPGSGEPAGPDGDAEEPGVFIPGEDETTTTTAAPAGAAGSGSPGTTQPRPSTSGGASLFPRPSTTSPPRATTTTTEFDPGYNDTLPYDLQRGRVDDDPEESAFDEPQTIERIIEIPQPRDTRALLVPLAGGLAIFVFAMQMTYFVRRRPALSASEDDFDDWMGL